MGVNIFGDRGWGGRSELGRADNSRRISEDEIGKRDSV